MSFNIILYKCKNKVLKGLTQDLFNKNLKILFFNEESEFLKLSEETEKSMIIYDGKDKGLIQDQFNKVNLKSKYILLLLLNPRESKKFVFERKPNVYSISVPSSLNELVYLIKLFIEISIFNKQISEKDNIIKAFEQAAEFSRKELMDAYESIKAHEKVTEWGRKELINIKESIDAWEKVSEFSRKELLERMREQEAFDNLHEFSEHERMFLEKVMLAWEHTMEMGRHELMKAYEDIKKMNVENSSEDKKNDS